MYLPQCTSAFASSCKCMYCKLHEPYTLHLICTVHTYICIYVTRAFLSYLDVAWSSKHHISITLKVNQSWAISLLHTARLSTRQSHLQWSVQEMESPRGRGATGSLVTAIFLADRGVLVWETVTGIVEGATHSYIPCVLAICIMYACMYVCMYMYVHIMWVR